MKQDESGAWTPICSACRTETITALHGQHRCLDCGQLWDGSERTEADIFAQPVIAAEDTQDSVMAILAFMWRRGMIEERYHGHEAKSR